MKHLGYVQRSDLTMRLAAGSPDRGEIPVKDESGATTAYLVYATTRENGDLFFRLRLPDYRHAAGFTMVSWDNQGKSIDSVSTQIGGAIILSTARWHEFSYMSFRLGITDDQTVYFM